MQPKPYKILHWLLIVMLTITPLRTIAGNSFCKIDVTSNVHSSVVKKEHTAGHHTMVQHVQIASADNNSMSSNQCCCCDDSQVGCSSNCDMGTSVSLILQESPYAAVFLAASESIAISSNIILRELTPPFRPPSANT